MKTLVYGAGVLGSLYAARLQEAGNDVTVLARGQRLEDIRQYGIVLEDEATGRQTTTPVRVIEALDEDEAFDLVMVVMRKNQVAGVLPSLAANRNTPNVLFLVNNAAGPDELTAALGRERVLLGFPGAGGAREGHIIRCRVVSGSSQPTTLGELSGETTPRLQAIAAALEGAGFPVATNEHMDAWLKTHVALVSPIANAIYMAGGDNYRLARTPDGLVLMIRAIREGMRVLDALNIPVTPAKYRILAGLPEPLMLAVLKRRVGTQNVELLAARHANAARDEMRLLAEEFQALARQSGLQTPAIDRLFTYTDPAIPPAPEGQAQIPPDWRSVRTALGMVAGFGLIGAWIATRRRRRG